MTFETVICDSFECTNYWSKGVENIYKSWLDQCLSTIWQNLKKGLSRERDTCQDGDSEKKYKEKYKKPKISEIERKTHLVVLWLWFLT